MREICTSGSMSGEWKRSMAELVRHRQTKEPETDRLRLNHRATPRLYLDEAVVPMQARSASERKPHGVVPEYDAVRIPLLALRAWMKRWFPCKPEAQARDGTGLPNLKKAFRRRFLRPALLRL